jgi:hypothetical protein
MKKGAKYAIFIVIAVIAVFIIFAVYSNVSKNPAQGSVIATVKKLNGNYDANESYAYHAGVNTINIDVGLDEGVITNISVVGEGHLDPISAHFISAVDAALPSLVVGKNIDDVNLPKQISGSSLTTATVNSYLQGLND